MRRIIIIIIIVLAVVGVSFGIGRFTAGQTADSAESTGTTASSHPMNDFFARLSADVSASSQAPDVRFVASATGVVTDTLTGLVWLKHANCGGMKSWDSAVSFTKALHDGWKGDDNGSDCALSDGSKAGQWRLPNVWEIQSLMDYTNVNPVLPNEHPFEAVQPSYYWTRTPRASNPIYAWYVFMNNGNVGIDRKNYAYYVWPVRGGTQQ